MLCPEKGSKFKNYYRNVRCGNCGTITIAFVTVSFRSFPGRMGQE